MADTLANMYINTVFHMTTLLNPKRQYRSFLQFSSVKLVNAAYPDQKDR